MGSLHFDFVVDFAYLCEVGLDCRFEIVAVLSLRVWVLSSTGLRSMGLDSSGSSHFDF